MTFLFKYFKLLIPCRLFSVFWTLWYKMEENFLSLTSNINHSEPHSSSLLLLGKGMALGNLHFEHRWWIGHKLLFPNGGTLEKSFKTSAFKPGMVGHTCNSHNQKTEAGGSQVCGQLGLPSESQVCLRYEKKVLSSNRTDVEIRPSVFISESLKFYANYSKFNSLWGNL